MALTALLITELTLEPPPDQPPTPGPLLIRSTGATRRTDDASRSADIILARPLFTTDRRPPTETFAPSAPDIVEIPLLSGTVIAGNRRVAMIVLPGAQRPTSVQEGERVGRFLVLRIGPGEVTADGPRGLVALRVSTIGAPDPAAAAAAQPPKDPRIRGPEDQDE